ncbi:hypothetical protein D3C76_1567010 [compost metagenome]
MKCGLPDAARVDSLGSPAFQEFNPGHFALQVIRVGHDVHPLRDLLAIPGERTNIEVTYIIVTYIGMPGERVTNPQGLSRRDVAHADRTNLVIPSQATDVRNKRGTDPSR